MALKLSAKGLLALSIAAAVSTTAVAQRKIEEVVVTAEKRKQPFLIHPFPSQRSQRRILKNLVFKVPMR